MAGLASFGAQVYLFPAEVEPADWKEPADYVLEHLGDNDLVRVHPTWNEDPLPYLTEVGDQISRQHDPVLGDLQGAERVWILAEEERWQEAVARLPYEPARQNIRSFGNVKVIETTLPDDAHASYVFLEQLQAAKVERVTPSKKGEEEVQVRHCKNWSERDRRWDCGGRDKWLYVGEVYRFIGDDAHRCIWAHPLPDGQRLRITFPHVPLAKELRVRAGMLFQAGRKKSDGTVRMRLLVDGEERGEYTYPPQTTRWNLHVFDTSELAGTDAPVTLEVRADSIKNRFFCVNGWVF